MNIVRRSRQRGQTLIIIFLGVLLFGGAGHALNQHLPGASIPALRSQIKDVVTDPQRRAALMAELDAWEPGRKAHDKRYAEVMKEVFARFEDPVSGTADFEQLFKQADTLNDDSEKHFLDMRDKLRTLLSEAEWRKVFPAPAETSQ